MQRFSTHKVLLIGTALAALSLAGVPPVSAAPGPSASIAASGEVGSGASATHTTTNGSTQIRTEPNKRRVPEPVRVYGPYVSPEQVRLVAD